MIVHVRDTEAQARTAHYLRTLLDAVSHLQHVADDGTVAIVCPAERCSLDVSATLEAWRP